MTVTVCLFNATTVKRKRFSQGGSLRLLRNRRLDYLLLSAAGRCSRHTSVRRAPEDIELSLLLTTRAGSALARPAPPRASGSSTGKPDRARKANTPPVARTASDTTQAQQPITPSRERKRCVASPRGSKRVLFARCDKVNMRKIRRYSSFTSAQH